MFFKKILYILGWFPAFFFSTALAKNNQPIDIAYLYQDQAPPIRSANLDPFVKNKGEPGAALAISDNNTTGQFTHQQFNLKIFTIPVDGKADDFFVKQIAGKYRYLVTVLPPEALLKIADTQAAQDMLLFDAATVDDGLRNGQCRRNVLHLLPSRAMRADALAQYMRKKRWTKWFLVVGPTPEDRLFAEAIKRSAKHFNMDMVAEKEWEHTFEARRTAQADVAVFSQVDDYDVLVVADEQGEFGDYLDYRTWSPRPVIGTQGLIATAWHRTHEQWGAVQLQNRFKTLAGRWMEEEDYAAYLAVRALGEAVTRTQSQELATVQAHLLSDKFALQGYKSNPLSFRAWDGQLRQPVLLAAPRSLVAVAPIEGYLHQKTELDTLGFDQPESQCHWNKDPS